VIRCPYHAWVYGLDGTLKAAPSLRDVPGFERGRHPLISASVVEWSGWIFVNASGDAVKFTQHMGGLGEVFRLYEPERLRVGARHDYVVAANWKLIAENYHECYHCTNIHPELCRVTPIDSGIDLVPDGSWAGGTMELMDHAQTMSLTGESSGVMLRGLDEEQLRQVVYLQIFPNLLVSAHPDYVMTHRLEPLDADRTVVECSWLFPPEALDRNGFDPSYAVEFWDVTNRQDWAACESVQRGAANRGFRPGPLSPRESTLYQFLTMTARGYLEGGAARPQIADVRLAEESTAAGKGGA
jgi:Rieske 2Fe-2S family protein